MKILTPVFLLFLFALRTVSAETADFDWSAEKEGDSYSVRLSLDGRTVVSSPAEGLWSVAFGWADDAPADWRHIPATERIELSGGRGFALRGRLPVDSGELLFQDAYTVEDGLLKCVRRFEYKGEKTLEEMTLSVRFRCAADAPQAFLPGILYYGNPSGERRTPGKVPVWHGEPGELAVFEEHRYPIPFACFEDAKRLTGAAIYTIPSPALRGNVPDQWWSMGVRTFAPGENELVLYSGFIGFNRQNSVAKALQSGPMKYPKSTIRIIPGTVIEKTFYLDLWPIAARGTAFQKPVRRGIELFKPYYAEDLPTTESILRGKVAFADSRWLEGDGYAGFNMYPDFYDPKIVFGWCGQADSLGFAYLRLAPALSKLLGRPESVFYDQVQRSLDHLSTSPVDTEGFALTYDPAAKQWVNDKDPVSMGQGMYNFAKAIEAGRDNPNVETAKWEEFLKKASDSAAARILKDDWRPLSTAEGFYIAPLILASRIFSGEPEKSALYKNAAEKAAAHYAERHLSMEEPYWGGTLDASCEDKEGAWAAFQGFLTLYEVTGERKYLDWAKHAGEVCLSYLVVWDIPLPPGRMADHRFRTRGWTVVSAQNQHIDVYGVLFAPEIVRLGRLLDIESYRRLGEVMFRSCGQLTDCFGSQGEQLQQTNFAQRGDMSDVLKLRGGYSEAWTVFWITAHFLNAAARTEEYKE